MAMSSIALFCIACAALGPLPARAQDATTHPSVPPSPVAPIVTPTNVQPDREVQLAADAFVKDPNTPDWVQPAHVVDSKTAGPAVLALADTQIMIGDHPVSYAYRAIKINDQTALTPLGRVPIYFIPDYQHVVLHTLQIVRDGVVLDRLPAAQVRFLQRETALESYTYSGVVTASILIDDLRVGDTLEVAYSTIGSNPVFGNRYGSAENWDQPLPVDDRRVIINTPVQRPVHWKFHGDLSHDFPAPVESVHDGVRTLRFEQRDIAALPPEGNVPSGFSSYRWLQMTEYDDWAAVSAWAAGLFAARDDAPGPERKALVAKLMEQPTTEQRVVAALEFVQSQVRYFSVSLGTSSHHPTAPDVVLARRYGDCKDKSLLLVALLKDMGIASTPELARLGNRIGFDDWLPSPLAFDHVIVAVDVDGVRYDLDSTRLGQHGKLARMGQAHDGAQVLPAVAAGGHLERIVAADREALTHDDRTESLTVDKLDGDGTLALAMSTTGVAAENVRVGLGVLTKERLDAAVTSDMDKRYPNAKLIEPVEIDDDRTDNRLTLKARFTLQKPVVHVDGRYHVDLRPDNFLRMFTLPQEANRRAPVALRFPAVASYRFDATFPDGVAMTIDPQTTTVDDRYFKSSARTSFLGNHAEVALELRTLTDQIAAADLPSFKEDLQKMGRSFPGMVLFADADIKKPVFLGLGKKDFAATLKDRQEDTVKRVSETIASGRLSGADLARAYCTRAVAESALGQRDPALQDADRVVELEPDDPPSLICRATVRAQSERFDGAIEDASQAIVLGAADGRAWQIRGQARFFEGRYAEAIDDFAKAATIDHDERTNLYHDVWRAMAWRRSGKPLPEDLQRRGGEIARGEWPRPLLGLFADRIAPTDVEALAAARTGDEAQMFGIEADFYSGEFYLAEGDAVKARTAFDAAIARGVIIYTEYGTATIERDRLRHAAH
jgi:lipoprotein NlpI/transglutaminase-like putative cysteine protease